MNIERLEEYADLLFENISGWEQRTLRYIGARIKKTGSLTMADAKALNNIAVVTQDMDAILKDLARTSGENISYINKIYSDVINSQHNANRALYDYRSIPFVPFENNLELQALVRTYAKKTAGTMINLTNTAALGFTDPLNKFSSLPKALYDTLGKATLEVATGASDFNSAMRATIERLGGSGIQVNYGSGITRSLAAVVRQNLLWGAKQASNEYNEMLGEELGCDGIEIDWHSNPRPSHEFMQGKQYSLEGKKTVNGITYESADRALNALEDYGCLHFKTPIILGVSEPAYSPEELKRLNEENHKPITIGNKTKTGYEWKQAMRNLESESRRCKNTITLAQSSGDNITVKKNRRRIKAINKKYNEISQATGIKAQPEKMRVFPTKSANYP